MRAREVVPMIYRNYVKRMIDVALSLAGLVVLALPMLAVALIVKMDSRGAALFWQRRVGLRKKVFMMPKFRTMYMETPPNMPTHMLENPCRWITRSGGWLRRLSIDELPQIWSVLMGSMSIIGPRPALWNQYDLITERDKYGATDIRPGLTGWAQINGRDELPIEVKARYDGEYVKKMSFLFDCKCFIGTIACVLKKEGVVEGGAETLQKAHVRERKQ